MSFICRTDINKQEYITVSERGTRCSSVVRAFAHGAMGRRIDPSWGGPIELFLIPAMCYPLCGMMHIKEPLLNGKGGP